MLLKVCRCEWHNSRSQKLNEHPGRHCSPKRYRVTWMDVFYILAQSQACHKPLFLTLDCLLARIDNSDTVSSFSEWRGWARLRYSLAGKEVKLKQ